MLDTGADADGDDDDFVGVGDAVLCVDFGWCWWHFFIGLKMDCLAVDGSSVATTSDVAKYI